MTSTTPQIEASVNGATPDEPPTAAAAGAIQIDVIKTERILVPIVGLTPLIVHNFSAKSKQQMLDAQQGRKTPKQARDPEAEYKAAFYYMFGQQRYGFPVTAFKAATVGAARFYGKDVKMTELRQFMWFSGQFTPMDPQSLIEIIGEPRMREDVVRLGGVSRSADLRYRPEFAAWRAVLDVRYVISSLSRASVLSLIDAGGQGIGVGEWRPEHRGEFGTYRVDEERGVEVVTS
jgi:hypothetical protein